MHEYTFGKNLIKNTIVFKTSNKIIRPEIHHLV